MKKGVVAFVVILAAASMSMGFMSSAQAYPDVAPSGTHQANVSVLVVAVVLLAAGGVALVVARRRRTN